ncbi:MAG TPA: endonuclease/exonuclease/phosphatase family protein [Allosphingosinicella sp.]|jgi:endonuclease/exonuclease/phosphatase family metal-dependent hydrolase
MASIAPQTLRVLGWNIENYGPKKDLAGGAELIKFIAEVIRYRNFDIAAICEVRQNWADKIGLKLKAELAGAWDYFASEQYVPGRLEQYLFLWNGATVTRQNIAGTKAGFQDKFFDGKKAQVGFSRFIKDRPPLMGQFEAKASKGKLRVAMYHAPEPKDWRDPRDAAINMATATDLRPAGMASVVMGDFNVKKSANWQNGNYGQFCFAKLVGEGFTQQLSKNELTSLTKRNTVITSLADCKCQPYDQIFTWTPGAPATAVPTRVEDLIDEAMKTAKVSAPLLALLKKLAKNTTKIGTYQDAFSAYRRLVSDHLPVSAEIAV